MYLPKEQDELVFHNCKIYCQKKKKNSQILQTQNSAFTVGGQKEQGWKQGVLLPWKLLAGDALAVVQLHCLC